MVKPGTPPLVTVFGASGFIGRYVCEALLKRDVRVRIAEKDPRKAYFLQPLGPVGSVTAMVADFAKPRTAVRAVEGADAVVNLVGVFKGDLESIHVETPRAIAEAARAQGAAMVHISALGADPASESDYGRTKGKGEDAVRKACPNATIIRPSTVFGAEDKFTNRFASMATSPYLPVVAPNTRMQPLFVKDLGIAVAKAALDPTDHAGKTYELAGDEVKTMRALLAEIATLAYQDPTLVDLPDFLSSAIASLGFIPGWPLTRDQWIMLQTDNVASGKYPGFSAFGINPMPMDAVASEWLARFRKGGRFAPDPAII
nr:complex I NDUFA9 subunit family protein [uncultured Sphingomonas sp.]